MFKKALFSLLGERIKKLRNDLNITQDVLSKKVGVSRVTISNIESGQHTIPVDILFKIAKALETEIHIILPTEAEVAEKMAESDPNSQIVSKLEKKNISPADIERITNMLSIIK
jgi:transcriptional regulator with XRE-family HTH domain